MPITISPVHRDHFPEWRRLREAVYTGIDRAFHEREMEQYFQETYRVVEYRKEL